MVEIRGIEPLASTLRTSRATNCAISPKTVRKLYHNTIPMTMSKFIGKMNLSQYYLDISKPVTLVLKYIREAII